MPPDDDLPADLQAAIDAFSARADRVLEPFAAEMADAVTPPLWHYTTQDGMRGILESGTLRASDIYHLNDPGEVTHGLEPALRALGIEGRRGPPEMGLFAQHVSAVLRDRISEVANFFVLSFSTDGDYLPQWQAYAENGHAYALCFDGIPLERDFVAS